MKCITKQFFNPKKTYIMRKNLLLDLIHYQNKGVNYYWQFIQS